MKTPFESDNDSNLLWRIMMNRTTSILAANGKDRRRMEIQVFAFVLGLLFIVGCGGPSFTKERYEQVDADMTKDEVISVLGAGEDVKNDYTDEQIELHNLPADTTFVRWQDPDDPKALTHIGFSGGKLVHRTTLHTE